MQVATMPGTMNGGRVERRLHNINRNTKEQKQVEDACCGVRGICVCSARICGKSQSENSQLQKKKRLYVKQSFDSTKHEDKRYNQY